MSYKSKLCPRCELVKAIDKFSKDKFGKMGLQTYCKSCTKRYRERNKEYFKMKREEYKNRRSENVS